MFCIFPWSHISQEKKCSEIMDWPDYLLLQKKYYLVKNFFSQNRTKKIKGPYPEICLIHLEKNPNSNTGTYMLILDYF